MERQARESSLKNLEGALQNVGVNDNEITQNEVCRVKERIRVYTESLRQFNIERLQEIQLKLSDNLKYLMEYTDEQISDWFQRQYAVPVQSKRDLECVAIAVSQAVSEKLQGTQPDERLSNKEELQASQSYEEQPKIEKKRNNMDIVKLGGGNKKLKKGFAKMALTAILASSTLYPCLTPSTDIPKNIGDYSIQTVTEDKSPSVKDYPTKYDDYNIVIDKDTDEINLIPKGIEDYFNYSTNALPEITKNQ
jgi:hypothetical protein